MISLMSGRGDPGDLRYAVAWLGHPGTVAAAALLIVNDHVLKAAVPGPEEAAWPARPPAGLHPPAGLRLADARLADARPPDAGATGTGETGVRVRPPVPPRE